MAVSLASIDPADGATWIYKNRPVTARLQRLDSNDYEKIETLTADFASGTLTDVTAAADQLKLAMSWNPSWDFVDDFNRGDSETVGNGWTEWMTAAKADIYSNKLRFKNDATSGAVKRSAGVSDYLLYVELPVTGSGHTSDLMFRIQDDTNYYTIRNTGTYIQLYKVINGSWTQVSTNYSKSLNAAYAWYYMLEVNGTTYSFKCWDGSGSEPSSWDKVFTDSQFPTGFWWGPAGIQTGQLHYFDNAKAAWTQAYQLSGNRVSGPYSVAAVGKFSTGIVEWDATVPPNTTLVISISKDGSNWTTVANGDRIALWDDGDDLAAESIYVKEELATTDSAWTPTLSELRLTFRPIDPALVEIVVNGVSCTAANGGLDHWNTAKVTAGPTLVDPCLQDVYFGTVLAWWAYGPETVTVTVEYDGVVVSTTDFDTECWATYSVTAEVTFYVSALGGIFDGPMSAVAWYFVSTIEPWLVRAELHYEVQGPPIAAFDAYYYVAHVFATDVPSSGIVGLPCPSDTPASGVVNGWTPSDTPASGVVQGWIRRDTPASGIAGNRIVRDNVASGIAGKRVQNDTPGSGVVYQVNLNNAIELRVISVEEAEALAELGISFE